MPLYSNKGQYQSTRRRHRRRKRRADWLMPALTLVLVCALAGTITWIAWQDKPDPAEPAQTDPQEILELPETVTLLTPSLPASGNVAAEAFVSGLEGTDISVAFAAEPSAEPGEQPVTLRFTAGNASCTRQTTCYRFQLENTVTVDVTEGRQADVRDFVSDETVEVAFAEVPDLSSCGEKTLTLVCGDKNYQVSYIVKESVPPVGTAQTVTAEIGTVPDPASLVNQIVDDSEVTVTYKDPPVLSIVGSYPVTLVLTDHYGNTSEVTSKIDVVAAANAPQFDGMSELRIQVGDTIAYKSGVTAVDPQDGQVSFTVDAAAVDRNQQGTYLVYYSAMDSDGNTTIVPRTVVVLDINQAAVEQYARAAIDKIITPEMTRDQQIYAVYKYTKASVQFVGTSDKTSVWHSAYEGFTTGKGDCYTYYAINTVLFDLLGIENLEVKRVGGTSNHWWNLVLHEDGKYYHVDSCPVAIYLETVSHFRMSESDLQTYTNNEDVATRRPNFYVYDKTLPEYEGIEIAP